MRRDSSDRWVRPRRRRVLGVRSDTQSDRVRRQQDGIEGRQKWLSQQTFESLLRHKKQIDDEIARRQP